MPHPLMCAYPDVNFHWACENQDLLVRTLRQRWGFEGYVESDRRALHSTVGSILARVSIELDEQPKFYSADNVMAALAAGQITEADIDELLRTPVPEDVRIRLFRQSLQQFPAHRLRGGRRCGTASGRRGHCAAQE